MAADVGGLLKSILDVTLRIERVLNQPKQSDKSKPLTGPTIAAGGVFTSKKVTVLDKYFEESINHLININSNILELIETMKEKDKFGSIAGSGHLMKQDFDGLSGGLKLLLNTTKAISKLPDEAINKFKDLLMILSLKNPKTGKTFVSDKDIEKSKTVINGLKIITNSVAVLGLSLIAFGIAVPLIFKGVAGFAMSLGLILLSMIAVDKTIKTFDIGFGKKENQTLRSIQIIIQSVALLGLSLIGFAIASPLIFKGVGAYAMTLFLLLTSILAVEFVVKSINKVENVVSGEKQNIFNSIWIMTKSIAILGITAVGYALLAPLILKGVGFIALTLALLGLAIFLIDKLIGSKGKESATLGLFGTFGGAKTSQMKVDSPKEGPLKSIYYLSASILIFAITGLFVGFFAKTVALGMLITIASISALGLALKFYKGTSGKEFLMISIGVAILSLSFGKWADVSKKLNFEDLIKFGIAIGAVSLIGYVLGKGSIAKSIITGSLVLGALGVALIPFSYALGMYARNTKELTWEKLGMLGSSIIVMGGIAVALGTLIAFTGGIGGGILLMVTGLLVGLGLALIPFSKALGEFSKVRWTKENTQTLKEAVGGVISAFSDAIGLKEILTLPFKIAILGSLGKSLSNLAKGVSDWANMQITEYDIQKDPKTGMNVLVPIGRRSLSESEIQMAAINIGYTLNALSQPLADFAKHFRNVNSKWVETGLNALSLLSNSLSNLASGVRDWSKMQVPILGIRKNPKTGQDELTTVDVITLTNSDIQNAALNIGTVITALTEPLSELGRMMKDGSESRFFGLIKTNYIKDGISTLKTLSESLSGLARGILDLSSNKIPIFEEKEENGVKKLVATGKFIEINQNVIETAKNNLANIITGFLGSFKINEDEDYDFENIEKQLNILKKISGVDFKKMNENIADLSSEKALNSFSTVIINIKDIFTKDEKILVGLHRFERFTSILEKLSKLTSPFEKFVKIFSGLNKELKEFSKTFKNMSPQVESYIKWTDTLTRAIELGRQSKQEEINKYSELLEKQFKSSIGINTESNIMTPEIEKKPTQTPKTIISEKTTNQINAQLIQTMDQLLTIMSSIDKKLSGTLDVNILTSQTTITVKEKI